MKRLTILAVVLAASALASCYWTGNWGQGGLTIDVSQIKPKQEGEVARVYLLADGKLFSTGGGLPFTAEVPFDYMSGSRISIQGLPVGPQYQALIGIGWLSGGVFTPYEYCKSGLFQISPGTDTTVNVGFPQSIGLSIALCADLAGKSLKGVTEAGYYSAFTAEETRLHRVNFQESPILLYQYDSYDLSADGSFRVNGLSDDRASLASDAFASGSGGVLPFDNSEGWNFHPDFSTQLAGDRNILESASFLDGADYAFFFRRAGGLGGAWVGQLDTYNFETWNWVNLDVPGVLDLAVSDNKAYFATSGGAFALPPAFLSNYLAPTLAGYRIPLPAGAPTGILSMDYAPFINTLFMGTRNGAWYAEINDSEDVTFIGTPTQISQTAGQSIGFVAVSSYNPTTHQAFLSDYWLYIRKSGMVYEIPFFAVLPGKPTGLAWDSGNVLYISGSEGLSAVYVGFC